MQQPQRRILVTYKKKHSDGTAARSVVAASRIEQSPEAKRLFSTTAIEDKREQSASGNADPLQAADTTAVLHTSIEQPELISAPHSRQSSPSKLRRINRMKVSQGPSSTSSANSQKETNEPIPFKQKQEELDLLRPVKKRSKRAASVIADEGKPPLIPPSNNFTSASFTSSVAFQTSSSSSHLSSDRSTLVSPSHLSKSTPHSATTSKTNAAVALTYAKSRSFLQAASDADDSVPDRSGRRTGGGNTVADDSGSPIDEGLDTSDDDEEKKKELRGVHELKESGKATRFTDEIEYITSGLGPHNPIGMRRSSYLELASKSLNPQFLLKARAHNVLIEFCEFLDDSDQIITSISIFIIFIMCQDRRNIDILVEHEKLLPFIIKNYKLKPDVLATLPRSKYERNFVLDFKRLIESSNLLLPHQVSNTCIGILCLEIFIGISSSVATPSLQNLLTDANIVGLILQNFEATCARSCPTPKCVALAAEEKTKGGGGGTGGMNCGTSAISLPLARRQTTAYFKLLRRLFVGESSISLSTRHRSSVWGSVLDALSCWFRDFQKVSLQGVVDSVSSAFDLVFLVLQFLIDASAEDMHLCALLDECGGSHLLLQVILLCWRYLQRLEDSQSPQLKEGAPIDHVRNGYTAILLSALALAANLSRNSDGLKESLISIVINVECPCFRPKACSCNKASLKCNLFSEILKLFKVAVKKELAGIPKTASVIICAVVGCLVSGTTTSSDIGERNSRFIRQHTDDSITFSEMAELLEDFANFHKSSTSARGAEDGVHVVDEEINGVEGMQTDSQGILKQMDRLTEIALVLRRA